MTRTTDRILLETEHLTKRYKNNTALNDVNLTLQEGGVYGLIGKNGAGKTTFIRLITGLAFPTNGRMELFGKHCEKDLQKVRRKIGALVEGPSLYPFMSAKEHLKIQQIQLGLDDDDEIDELLDLVGLSDVGNKKARHYSLGMRQRLGIAMSLVGNPEFLIWDEPINGLDPEGIRDIRDLIRTLNKAMGKTLLISSHILGELEHTATDFILLDHGEIVEEISKNALAAQRKDYVYLATSDNFKACALLSHSFPTTTVAVDGNRLRLENFRGNIDQISTLLSEYQIYIREMREEEESLEDYMLAKIGAEQ